MLHIETKLLSDGRAELWVRSTDGRALWSVFVFGEELVRHIGMAEQEARTLLEALPVSE